MTEAQPKFIERIVCLANSRKPLGRCVAGKRIDSNSKVGTWIRPISAQQSHAISEDDRRYQNGHTAQFLDIIEIPCIEPRATLHQTENVLIDDRFYWELKGRPTWKQLQAMVDAPGPLWANGYSAYYNQNNRVPEVLLDPQGGSLKLIPLDRIVLHAGPKAPDFGNMKLIVRASFDFAGQHYKLDLTDPELEKECLNKGNGDYELKSVLACISLAELHTDGYAYKVVASIITEQRASS